MIGDKKSAHQPESAIPEKRIEDIRAEERREQQGREKEQEWTVQRRGGETLVAPADIGQKSQRQAQRGLLDGHRQAQRDEKERQQRSSEPFFPHLLNPHFTIRNRPSLSY